MAVWQLLAWVLLAPAAAPNAAAGGETLPILEDVAVDRDEEGVYVSMEVKDGLTPVVREELRAGVPVAFHYTVKLCRKRLLWLSKTVASRTIETRARLDVLTREYQLSRSMDGRVLEARSTASAADAARHLCRLSRIKIAPPPALASDLSYELRARAKVQDEFVLYVIPWAVETPWIRATVDAPSGSR